MQQLSLKDLPEDIYSLFSEDTDHIPSEENLDEFCSNLKDLLRARFLSRGDTSRPIRFSGLGRPDRQVWYDAHPIPGGKEPINGPTYVKFLYGDVIEQLLLFLAKEAGHAVERTQATVEYEGVTGSIDCIIDGVVVDVKSASPYGFQKFKNETVTEDDPFGYVAQLSGYSTLLNPGQDAAWLAMDKVSGEICVSTLKRSVISHYSPSERISHLKEIVASETPPDKCYSPVPDGQSGNMKLPTGCSYCSHKHRCYPDLRKFIYSTGPRFLTHVVKLPNVYEATNDIKT